MLQTLTPEQRARAFAKEWHRFQLRSYVLTPYDVYLEAVVNLVRSVPHTQTMLLAAWFTDVLKCTFCSFECLANEFGAEVARMVLEISNVGSPAHGDRAMRKALDRAHLARARPEAKTVKLASLIENTRVIVKFRPDSWQEYLRERRLLLDESLREGDPALWAQGDLMVKEAMADWA